MSLTFSCGVCGKRYTVSEQMAGKWVKCRECESTIEVPGGPRTGPVQRPQEPATRSPRSSQPAPQQMAAQSPLPQPPGQQLPSPGPATSGRPLASPAADDSIDPKIIAFAVAAVALVVVAAIAMMVVVLGSDPKPVANRAGEEPGNGAAEQGGSGRLDFSRKPDTAAFGEPRTMASRFPDVVWKEVPLRGDSDQPATTGKLWVYMPAGQNRPGSLPCVLIGPAGTRMIHGIGLAEGDQPEHYPYARAGFTVVAYEIDGPLPDDSPSDARLREAYLQFTAASAGVTNARVALEYARTQLPAVDTDRIFVAGHSSAGTVALLCAEHVDGLAGCVAYAPCSDLKRFLSDFARLLDGVLPDLQQYMKDGSPLTHVGQLRCPVMVYHSRDDRVVGSEESRRFVNEATLAGANVVLESTGRGGHYDAMIDHGIPLAIAWMKGNLSGSTAAASSLPGSPPSSPMIPSGAVRAHIHFEVLAYPGSGDPQTVARNALRSLTWADSQSIRVDRDSDEVIIAVRVTMVSTSTAKALLERAGFKLGSTSYKSVGN